MRRLLRWLLPDADQRAFENEQAELYEARRIREGDGAAARGRRADRRRLIARLLVDRLGSSPIPSRRPRAGEVFASTWRDLRHSARSLSRSPGLATTIVLTVGLGLGATTAMVSVIQAVVINPLPYRAPDRLFLIRTQDGDNLFPLSVADYNSLAAQQTSFETVAASAQVAITTVIDDVAERQRARVVTASYFRLLGLTPIAGRLFDASDEHVGGRAVVLTAPYWRARFGGAPNVIGSTITIDGAPHTVVGVLAPSHGPLEQDIALFEIANWPTPTAKGPFFLTVLGSLRPTVSRPAAEQEVVAISRRIFPIWQSTYQDARAVWVMTDLKSRVVGTAGELWLVGAGVVGLLLIACTNAASLLVARALERRRELAVRVALGASRAQIVRAVLTESAVLIFAAAVVATLVATGAIKAVTMFGAGYIPRLDEVRLGGAALGWLVGLTALSTFLVGILPAWGGLRIGRGAGLSMESRTMSEGRAGKRVRRFLAAAEFAVATPLVIAAGLVIGSLNQLLHVDVGMDSAHLLTASLSLSKAQYPEASARAFWDRARASLLSTPGVVDVAFADSRPPAEANNINNFDLSDRPTPPGEHQPVCPFVAVTQEFFRTAGLSLVRGRLFESHDFAPDAPSVLVVDRAWARRFFGTDSVIGRQMHSGGCAKCPPDTVVGEVTTVKYLGLEKPDEGTVYYPMAGGWLDRFFIVRTAGAPSAIAPVFQPIVRVLDPNLAVARVATLDDLVSTSIEMPRYLSVLVGAFAVTALLLSVVGIYGAMAHFVTRHAREIGIRLALGGAPHRVSRMVLVTGLQVVGAGIAVGVVAAWLLTHLMASVLFGVTPTDATTFVGVPAVMVLVAMCACLQPARRAAQVEPAAILRDA